MKQATKAQSLKKTMKNGDLIAGTPIFLRVRCYQSYANEIAQIDVPCKLFHTLRFLTRYPPPLFDSYFLNKENI